MKTPLTSANLLCILMLFFGMVAATNLAAQSYTVTLDKQGGSEGTNQVTTVTGKAMPVAISPVKDGFAFNGYYDAVSGGKQYYTPAMASASNWDKSANTTLYARWTTLPASFSWGNHLSSNQISTPKNQMGCGSCWAFSMAASYEARKRIAENQPGLVIDLSEQHMVSCWAGTCSGGGTTAHFNKLVDEGVPDEACFPYVGTEVACSPCADWTSRVYKATSCTYHSAPPVAEIKREIMVNGPVYAVMNVYSDLYSYTSGVYSNLTGNTHSVTKAIIIYGWDDANDCWLVVNTWGTSWGELGPGGTKGFFRVSISDHKCGFAQCPSLLLFCHLPQAVAP